MKGNIILAAIWIIIALVLTCMLIFGMMDSIGDSFNFFSFGKNNIAEPDEVKTFPANGIDTINIDLSSCDAVVKRGSDREVKVELFGSKRSTPIAKLESGTLTIYEESNFGMGLEFGKHGVVVYVPHNFDCNRLRISLHSGTINAEDVSCKSADFSTTSGTIKVSDGSFNDVSAESSSGTIAFDDCNSKNLDCRVSSGTVRVSGSYGRLNLKTSSGTIKAELNTPLTSDSSMHSSSGTVKVQMPKDADCDIIYSCGSGNYSNTITGIHGKSGRDKMGKGGPKLDLHTSSGMIKVVGTESIKHKTAENSYYIPPVSQEDLARAEAFFQNTTVYYEYDGKFYHSHEDCGYLKNSKEVIEGKVAQAFEADKTLLCPICAKKDGITNEDLPVVIATVEDEKALLANKNSPSYIVIPTSADVRQSSEVLDWYSSIGSIRTKTSDKTPATVVVEVVLGYKKGNKQAATELTQRNTEIHDLIRRYFAKKKASELLPKKEEKLQKELLNLINDVLNDSKIRDVKFKSLEVIEQ